MSSYIVRKLEPSEFDVLIPLMQDAFGMNVNIEYFRWKYLENPAGPFIGFIAIEESTGAIGAYYGVIPELYSFGSEVRTIYQSCDTMTHSAHRRLGLFQKLATQCYDYLRDDDKLFVIGFGGPMSTPGLIKFGWTHVLRLRFYVYPKALQPLFTLWTSFSKPSGNIVAISDLAQIAGLLKQSNAQAEVHSLRTPSVYGWRIANPLWNHRVIAYQENDGSFTGYICFNRHAGKLLILDFHFENSHASKALFNALKAMLRRGDKGIVALCQEKSALSATLRKAGFLSNPLKIGPLAQTTPFVIYSNEENMKRYSKPELWLVNSFDHDAT